MVNELDLQDLERFFAHLDSIRPPATPLNLGLSTALRPDIRGMPALLRNVANPSAGSENGLPTNEYAALAELLKLQAATVEELHQALPSLSSEQVDQAVLSLARKSLVFPFSGPSG
jgi:hypothetical protein